ncbi:hypothetical protein QML40_11120, partial [Aerococcus urinaeequi]
TFYSGKSLIKKRRRFKKLRQSLQAKNTKSSRRRLKTIERRENRWMNDVNHQSFNMANISFQMNRV